MKSKTKNKGGRPKHVATYETGNKAQANFADAMRAMLAKGKKPDAK